LLRTGLTRYLWWILARMGLCLAGVGDGELQRLLFKRLRWIVLWAGAAACLGVLGNGLAAAPPPPAGTTAPVRAVSLGAYVVAALLALMAVAIWLYCRIIVTSDARPDGVPEAQQGHGARPDHLPGRWLGAAASE